MAALTNNPKTTVAEGIAEVDMSLEYLFNKGYITKFTEEALTQHMNPATICKMLPFDQKLNHVYNKDIFVYADSTLTLGNQSHISEKATTRMRSMWNGIYSYCGGGHARRHSTTFA